MAKKIDVSLQKLTKFADELVNYANNMHKTSGVFEEIVTPVAKKSGSQLLEGVSADVTQIKEEFGVAFRTAREAQSGMKEYTDKLAKLNSL